MFKVLLATVLACIEFVTYSSLYRKDQRQPSALKGFSSSKLRGTVVIIYDAAMFHAKFSHFMHVFGIVCWQGLSIDAYSCRCSDAVHTALSLHAIAYMKLLNRKVTYKQLRFAIKAHSKARLPFRP